MNIVNDGDYLPPVTEEQKEALIRAVKAGRIPWSNKLMARAGIKYEDVFPDGTLPPIIKPRHDVEIGYVEEYNNKDPADKYMTMIYQLALMHGYKSEYVIQKMTTSQEFKDKVKEVVKTVSEGGQVLIKKEDLDFLHLVSGEDVKYVISELDTSLRIFNDKEES